MENLGKLIVIAGAVLIVVGVIFFLAGRSHLPIGHLPGDIIYRRKNVTFYFPLATSIIISILLSLVLYVLARLHR